MVINLSFFGKKLIFLKIKTNDKKTNEEVKVSKEISVDYDNIEKEVALLGYYCITTSEIEKSDSEIIETFRTFI